MKRKDIEISAKRYLQDALSAMALGLFGSLLIGVIFDTLGTQTANLFGDNAVSAFCVEDPRDREDLYGCRHRCSCGVEPESTASGAVYQRGDWNDGCDDDWIWHRCSRRPCRSIRCGSAGRGIGKMVSKETKVDILVTPAVTLIMGGIGAKLIGPAIGWCMLKLGDLIMTATEWQPFLFGIVISRCSGTGSDSTDIQCGSLHHAGSFRSCCRRGDCRMLRADGRLRCSKL